MPLTPSPDQGNPDFSSRQRFIQPQTQRHRAPFRSPIESSDLNLRQTSQQLDIAALYQLFDNLTAETEDKLGKLYNGGTIEFPNDYYLKTIREYAFDLKYLRREIENLKQGLT